MIRFSEFLLEEGDKVQLKDFLTENCSNFCAKANIFEGGAPLVRRVNKLPQSFERRAIYAGSTKLDAGVAHIRKQRIPSAMPSSLSQIVDDWFLDRFGVRARSEALFCVGGHGGRLAPAAYGSTNLMILPMGDFKVVWSPQVVDLYATPIDTMVTVKDGVRAFDKAAIWGFLDKRNYKIGSLPAAITARSEIMVCGDEYLAITFKDTTRETILNTIVD